MTRHNIFGALLIAAAFATASAAEAQALKIGVVNFGRLLEESPQAKAAQQALENEFAPAPARRRGTAEGAAGKSRQAAEGSAP